MKLFFLVKTLALPGGGAERVLAEVGAALAGRGHLVTVATFDKAGNAPFYAFAPAVERVPLGIGDVRARTGLGEAARRIRAVRRLVGEARPDVAIGFMHSAYIPLGLALLGTSVPVVASEHIAWDHYRRRPLQAALLQLTPLVARPITVLSPAIRRGFPRSIRRHMIIVPDPVRVEGRRPADVAGEGRPFRTLLAVGRLEPQKDHGILIAAFARIAAEFPGWRLRIVGEGERRATLEAQVRRLGLAERVSLPGATRDIEAEYEAAQLFAMPSAYESFGLTTAEALGHGLPVVGFADCPGTNELVKDDINGRLVAGPDREAALAGGIAALMESADLRVRLGAAGPASVAGFAPEAVADIWEALLREVAGKRG